MVSILITGATSAIGTSLALEYATPDAHLHLQGRQREVLAEVAQACAERGARVSTQELDLRDTGALEAWLATLGPIDLAILNAGINIHVGARGEPEPWQDVEALLDVNLRSAMRIAQALLPAMRARRRGQIAFMSSLAAWFGLPVTPAYCASKAGIKAYGEALGGWLAPEGVRVSVIMPGYVRSAMCRAMPGPKPWLWSPQRAARTIRRGLERGRARISFPFLLAWGCWWLAVLPAAWSQRILRWLNYGA